MISYGDPRHQRRIYPQSHQMLKSPFTLAGPTLKVLHLWLVAIDAPEGNLFERDDVDALIKDGGGLKIDVEIQAQETLMNKVSSTIYFLMIIYSTDFYEFSIAVKMPPSRLTYALHITQMRLGVQGR